MRQIIRMGAARLPNPGTASSPVALSGIAAMSASAAYRLTAEDLDAGGKVLATATAKRRFP
jgi:hypothetical protein